MIETTTSQNLRNLFRMKKFAFIFLTFLSLLSGCSNIPPRAPESAKNWSFWIEQDGKIISPDQTMVLAKKPFVIHFKGSASDDYGLAATPVMEELPVSGTLESIFRVSNGLLVDDPNTKISINAPGLIQKSSSSWNMWAYHFPSEVGFISSFQKRTENPDKTVTFSRTVDTLCIDSGQPRDDCKPISSPVFKKFYVLVTRIPQLHPGQSIYATRWLDPTLVSVQFQ